MSVLERVQALNPYESDGYGVCRNRDLKELMLEMPERAAIAFEMLDWAGKEWGMEEEFTKRPLAHLAMFFYGEANTLDELKAAQGPQEKPKEVQPCLF